jgi:hypothetical protein
MPVSILADQRYTLRSIATQRINFEVKVFPNPTSFDGIGVRHDAIEVERNQSLSVTHS